MVASSCVPENRGAISDVRRIGPGDDRVGLGDGGVDGGGAGRSEGRVRNGRAKGDQNSVAAAEIVDLPVAAGRRRCIVRKWPG